MAFIIGVEKGFVRREDGIARIQKIMVFLGNADRFHGAWPHWIDGTTGKVRPFSALDDGADLVEGTQAEVALATQAESLWIGVKWDWFTQGQEVLYWHWSPNHGFAINLQLKGYNEVLIANVLAAASPDYGIGKPTVGK
jgi:hypothetical protein